LAALAVPAVAADVGGPDAKLLGLGVQLEDAIRDYAAQYAIDEERSEFLEQACIAAGLPRIPLGSMPDKEWHTYQAIHQLGQYRCRLR
jgi:hypothetical protein